MSPSLRARLLNGWLRLTEKPHLARMTDIARLRRSFEVKARLLFHAPRQMQIEQGALADVQVLHVRSKVASPRKVILYFHGGAYVFGSARTHAAMLARLCKEAGAEAHLVEYRLAPEHPFPAAVEDALASYEALLASVPRERIVIGGDSAGGGLALALLGELCRLGVSMPAGVFALSPLTDVSFSGASVKSNARAEVVLPVARVQEMRQMYLGDADPKDPRASPLFGHFEGACPVWLTVGDTEILRDDSVRMAERLTEQGVDVSLSVARNLPHVWPIFHNFLPEARQTHRALAAWITEL